MKVLEYAPDTSQTVLRLKTPEETCYELSDDQELSLKKAHALLGFHAALENKSGFLSRVDLVNAITSVIDEPPSEEMVNDVMMKFCSNGSFMSLAEFRNLLTRGPLHPQCNGRYWVAISLAEAETIRRILHLREHSSIVNKELSKDSTINPQLIPNTSTEIALRFTPMCAPNSPQGGDGGVIFDASWGWQTERRNVANNLNQPTKYEASLAYSCFRFFDCDMHFSPASLNVLIRAIRGR